MNQNLIDNVNALMDSQNLPRDISHRAECLASICEASSEEMLLFLLGEGGLPKGALALIADLYEVDVIWLVRESC